VGYGDARVNKSRVHTRIFNSGLGREQQHGTITIWRTKSGLRWGPRSGFDTRRWYGDGCPGCRVGVVSPSVLAATMPGQAIGVWSRVHQVILAVWGMARWLQSAGGVADMGLVFFQGWVWGRLGPIVLWVIGISQDYLKGVRNITTPVPGGSYGGTHISTHFPIMAH